SLATDLHTSLSTIQWVTSGYLLALTLVLPLNGWLVDRIGARRLRWPVCQGRARGRRNRCAPRKRRRRGRLAWREPAGARARRSGVTRRTSSRAVVARSA
ncbi:hypothetical protein QZM26_26800, partial [Burkholderia multivorans]|nr:hypothetical protein [Burkholderia multivorans]